MTPDWLQLITDIFLQLGWSVSFYFSSMALVLLAFVPLVAHVAAIISDKKILFLPFNLALQLMAFLGRISLIMAILVIGGFIVEGEIFTGEAAIILVQSIFNAFLLGGIDMSLQLMVGLGVIIALYALLAGMLSEYRTAKLIERAQRSVSPWKVRRILLAVVADLVLVPVAMVFVFHALQFL